MKHLHVMIKPASASCNMRCAYCFYNDVSLHRERSLRGIMTPDTADKLINNVFRGLNDGDGVTFAFQGGEPLLAGLLFFKRFTETVSKVSKQKKKVGVGYAMQTNGLAVDEAWCAFFRENKFLIGLSMDGPQKYHDQNRKTADGKGTYRDAEKAKALFDKNRVEYNILTVLTNELARHPREVWSFITKNRIRYIQFIPCMDDLGEKGAPYALTPARFASFYAVLLKLWEDSIAKGIYISVKLFDDLMILLKKGKAATCGMTGECHPQFVVEADGSVYPCDFYCVDEYFLGNICELTPKELYETDVMKRFLSDRGTVTPLCGECEYRRICGGNCKRMRAAMCVKDNTCGYRSFLDTYRRLRALAANRP